MIVKRRRYPEFIEVFNDRNKVVYLCDGQYQYRAITSNLFHSLYFEIATRRFVEIEFCFTTGCILNISNYTDLIVPEYKLLCYDKEKVLAVLEAYPNEDN